uniref:Uncharacterized protein n=1 Tax=Ditylenchus dipsaci TaxID=166011 RepID=A0A915DN15_9BILA
MDEPEQGGPAKLNRVDDHQREEPDEHQPMVEVPKSLEISNCVRITEQHGIPLVIQSFHRAEFQEAGSLKEAKELILRLNRSLGEVEDTSVVWRIDKRRVGMTKRRVRMTSAVWRMTSAVWRMTSAVWRMISIVLPRHIP